MHKPAGGPGLDHVFVICQRVIVLTFVAVIHFAAFMTWLNFMPDTAAPKREMEVALLAEPAVAHAQLPLQQPLPREVHTAQPRVEKPAPAPQSVNEGIAWKSDVPTVVTEESAAVPVAVADLPSAPLQVEPDFKASYLNNRLIYPRMARRMGIQGRVVLNVEVLADGQCGNADVAQSSGHEVLDRAALESVKAWHFVPARHGTQAVTRWFRVPITFSLKDEQA